MQMAKYCVLTLTDDEHTSLTALVHQRRVASQRLVRAQCLLAVATNGLGWTDQQTAQAHAVSTRTLERLRQRACEAGVEAALLGQPRQQWPASKYTGAVEAHLVATACSAPPAGHAHWTLHLLAERVVDPRVLPRASAAMVGRVLKKNELQPWKRQMWVIPPAQNAAFVCAMERVGDVCQRPYDPSRPVVCLDESPKQLLRESRTPLRRPAGSTRHDCEYHRQGVAQLSMLHEPLAGRRRVQAEDRHDRLTFARVVARLLDEDYAQAERVTVVPDNLSAHQPAAFCEVFGPARAHALLQRVEFVFTPKHGSWLNMAEIEFAALLTHGLPQRVPDRPTLEAHCLAWQLVRNQRGKPTNWQFTAANARLKLKRLYPTIS